MDIVHSRHSLSLSDDFNISMVSAVERISLYWIDLFVLFQELIPKEPSPYQWQVHCGTLASTFWIRGSKHTMERLVIHPKAATETRDLLAKYLFERGYLPGKCLCVRGIGVSWKIVCVRGLDRVSWKIVGVRGLDWASWKMSICSMRK